MHISTLFSLSAVALTANAFLLPPSLPPTNTDNFNNIPDAHSILESAHRGKTVWLDCPSCPFPANKEGPRHGRKSELLLQFTTGNNGKAIMMNGGQIFPLHRQPPPENERTDYTVNSMQRGKAGHAPGHILAPIQVKGVSKLASLRSGPGKNTAIVQVTVSHIGSESVTPEKLSLAVSVTNEDELSVKSISLGEHPGKELCFTRLCSLRHSAGAHLAKVKGACKGMGRKVGHKFGFKWSHETLPDGSMKFHGDPVKIVGVMNGGHHHPHRPHMNHGPKPGCGGVMHKVGRFVHSIVLPILVGITAGLAISAVGMITGQIIFLIWSKLRSRRSGGYERVEQSEAEEGRFSEDLPQYEAGEKLPEYVDDEKTQQQS